MASDRRGFIIAGLTAATIAGQKRSAKAAEDSEKKPAEVDGLTCLDYGRSFITNAASFNNVRFWVESRTILIDGDKRVDFYQCGSCKSENTFAEKDLFVKDNYDFLPILGDGHWLVFRRTAQLNPNYRVIKTTEGMWGEPTLKLREAARLTVLDSWEKIRDYTAAATPIVSRTEITNEETGLRAIIECPVKTMNISIDRSLYQVDTGPIAYPDLSRRFEPLVDCLRLAFVAFNALHFADFVVEQPTALPDSGDPPQQIHHFSAPFSQTARNTLIATEG